MRILVAGAGKSSGVLIETLLAMAQDHDWTIAVADLDEARVQRLLGGHPRGVAARLDLSDQGGIDAVVDGSAAVLCMLPPHLQDALAEAAVHRGAHFLTASYLTPAIRALDETARRNEVTVLGEMGLDPGIDHMSAMESLDHLRARGAHITAFETFTGGLVAPAHQDDNPWRYKFTWNPRNVVLAGRGGVKFRHGGHVRYIPYHRLFRRTERIEVPGWGAYDAYPNRDSLQYRNHYDLHEVDTIYRGTLRLPGYCQGWDCLVQLGLTDDSFELEGLGQATWRELTASFLPHDPSTRLEARVARYLGLRQDSPQMDQLRWLGLFEDRSVGIRQGTAARALQHLLESRWELGPNDQDMCVMLHRTEYEHEGGRWRELSCMVVVGQDAERTAMATTVGLPMAVAADRVVRGAIRRRGVIMPTAAEVYREVLPALRARGIRFETTTERLA